MDSIWIVTNENFPQFIVHHPISVLYFWADWYSGDRYMKYRLRHLSSKYPKVKFGFMDVDLNLEMVKLLGITKLPSVAFFLRGAKERVVEGPVSLLKLSKLIATEQLISERRENLRVAFLKHKEVF